MKLTACTDVHMFSKQVETKFEMLLDEYNVDTFKLIGLPLEKLPLNCDGLPLIIQMIHDYIVHYGLYDKCLFDEVYSENGREEHILNAYEFVSGSRQSCGTIIDVDAVDVATVLVMWLFYLPEPLISLKQFLMICDLSENKSYEEILSSMDNITRQTLQQVMEIIDAYERQHKSHKEKLASLFTLLLTKHEDIVNKCKSLQFIENLKIVLMERELIETKFIQNQSGFNKNNVYNNKNQCRFWSDDRLPLTTGLAKYEPIIERNAFMKSSSSNLMSFGAQNRDYNEKLHNYNSSFNMDNLKTKYNKMSDDNQKDLFPDCAGYVDELISSSQIDEMRTIERTMATHPRSIVKQTKKKSIRQHVENVLKSGFLSKDESILLQNTLELMKILSKIKNVQNQINIQRRIWDDELGCENEDTDKHYPELNFLNNRLELLVNQKNNYLTKTGLSYGRLYNRTVLNLKNAQKKAFKLHEDEKNNKKNENNNIDQLIFDIYNIQTVMEYLENNCGSRELPWRSSKGCPGRRNKTNKQLNCVTVVSELQTISEHEVMETIPQSLVIPVKCE